MQLPKHYYYYYRQELQLFAVSKVKAVVKEEGRFCVNTQRFEALR